MARLAWSLALCSCIAALAPVRSAPLPLPGRLRCRSRSALLSLGRLRCAPSGRLRCRSRLRDRRDCRESLIWVKQSRRRRSKLRRHGCSRRGSSRLRASRGRIAELAQRLHVPATPDQVVVRRSRRHDPRQGRSAPTAPCGRPASSSRWLGPTSSGSGRRPRRRNGRCSAANAATASVRPPAGRTSTPRSRPFAAEPVLIDLVAESEREVAAPTRSQAVAQPPAAARGAVGASPVPGDHAELLTPAEAARKLGVTPEHRDPVVACRKDRGDPDDGRSSPVPPGRDRTPPARGEHRRDAPELGARPPG